MKNKTTISFNKNKVYNEHTFCHYSFVKTLVEEGWVRYKARHFIFFYILLKPSPVLFLTFSLLLWNYLKEQELHFLYMRWWFSRSFKSFLMLDTITNFLFASLKLLTILKLLKETLLWILFSVIVRCSLEPTFHWLQGKCTYRKSNLCIPGKELFQSQFLHWCVSEQFVYSQDRSTYWAAAKKTDRSWKCIILSQIFECRNWEIEHYNSVLVITRLHSFISGNNTGPFFWSKRKN